MSEYMSGMNHKTYPAYGMPDIRSKVIAVKGSGNNCLRCHCGYNAEMLSLGSNSRIGHSTKRTLSSCTLLVSCLPIT